MSHVSYRISLVQDPAQLPAAQWDALVDADPQGNPFLRHAFLQALHASGAAVARTGWRPCWLALWAETAGAAAAPAQLAAAAPLYIKAHSFGEYVFDWSWAEACERAGRDYYPKWLVAVPFTPVTGTRFLARDSLAREALVTALVEMVGEESLSSLHVLFAPDDQIDALAARGLLVRQGVQFHWRNRGYAHFDDFLAALTQPKRKKIRAERRKVAQDGVHLERRLGHEIGEGDWRFFHECYAQTYAEHGSRAYLNLDFFERLGASMPHNVMLVLARRGSTPIASALGVFDRERGSLYGRYWGAVESVPCLHFECCYYQMQEFAIEQGLQVCEGGAQGVHKLARGFDPVVTRSAHWLRDADLRSAVAHFLARETLALDESVGELEEHRAWRLAGAVPDRGSGHAST